MSAIIQSQGTGPMTFTPSLWCYTVGVCSLVLYQLQSVSWSGTGVATLSWALGQSVHHEQLSLAFLDIRNSWKTSTAHRVMLGTSTSTRRTFPLTSFKSAHTIMWIFGGGRRMFWLVQEPSSGPSKPGRWILVVQFVIELPEGRHKLHPFCLLSIPRGCSSVQYVSCAKVPCCRSRDQLPPRSSAHPCPEGPQLPPKPPSLGCYCGTRQGKGAEAQLVGRWQGPALPQVWRAWLGVGSVGRQGCVLSSR